MVMAKIFVFGNMVYHHRVMVLAYLVTNGGFQL
jgi:hypothetical protein